MAAANLAVSMELPPPTPITASAFAADVKIAPLASGSVATFAQILSNATGRPFAVAGDVDNATFSEMLHPALTTLGHPKEAFGALAARKMLRMIAGEKEESTIIPWNLIERDSLPAKYR